MRSWPLFSVLGGALLIGCAHPTGNGDPVPPLETISYEMGPCYGVCPVYRIVIDSAGKGVFTGIRHTSVVGERGFSVTPTQFRQFRTALEPYLTFPEERIYQPSSSNCEEFATDMPSVDIKYVLSDRPGAAHLNYYYGCGGEQNRAMGDAIRTATDLLPVAAMIGKR